VRGKTAPFLIDNVRPITELLKVFCFAPRFMEGACPVRRITVKGDDS
jgi:hypothetical protein